MSAGGAFGGAKGYQPRPPEKGVFPLDHFGECKQAGSYTSTLLVLALCLRFHTCLQKGISGAHQVKEEYMQCLKSSNSQAEPCRKLAKAYLECRMERWEHAPVNLNHINMQLLRWHPCRVGVWLQRTLCVRKNVACFGAGT